MNRLPDDDAVWKALAHSTRRSILDALFTGPRRTGELVTELGLDRHVVMAHLEVLRSAGLVTSQKQGRVRINSLNPVPIQEIHQRWVSPAGGPWAAALIAVRAASEAAARPDTQDDSTLDDWKISG